MFHGLSAFMTTSHDLPPVSENTPAKRYRQLEHLSALTFGEVSDSSDTRVHLVSIFVGGKSDLDI